MIKTLTKKLGGQNQGIGSLHIGKRDEVGETTSSYNLDDYEREKNCCPDCEQERVKLWGRPTDEEIQKKANFYRSLSPKEYDEAVKQIKNYATAREREDTETLDVRVWSQFKDCERGCPYWADADFKKIISLLETEE